jgi:hypothetical protein
MHPTRHAMAYCAAIALGVSNAQAGVGTNFSDQWWNPGESGWGASLLQQSDVIFVDLFVYGPDSRPVWYVATEYYQTTTPQGHVIYRGDLYVANGPYFGAGTFNPGNVTSRNVGTMIFDFDTVDTGTLTYTADGISVTKQIERYFWKNEDFTGNYYGGMITDVTACTNPATNGHVEDLGVLVINQGNDNSFAMASEASGFTCNYTGTYLQAGHMGSVHGTYNCTSGVAGTFSALEMEKTENGMTGRIQGQNNLCQFSGHFGGVAR